MIINLLDYYRINTYNKNSIFVGGYIVTNIELARNGKPTPFGIHGKLQVKGAHLVDKNGDICQLRGLSSHNLSSYPEYINAEAFTQFTDEYGITIMRLAMYSAEADDVKGYADGDDAHKKELEDLIIKGVEIAAKLGIYALIDWHILLDYDPNMHVDMAIAFFKKMCPILKDYDNVIYEICNEPNMDCTWAQITNYANQVIPVIQDIDKDKVIIVGTPVWSQRVDEAADAPLNYDNLMYTLHFYAGTHKEDLRDVLRYAISKDLPVFVTEFGSCNADGAGDINDEETGLWLGLLNENNISYVVWNLSNKDEASAIISKDCTKINNFEDTDFSPSGTRFKKYMNL